jgi:hypothetical protein
MDSKMNEKLALLVAIVLIAGVAVFFVSDGPRVGFVAKLVVNPANPIAPGEPLSPPKLSRVDCASVFGPACGGSCKVVDSQGSEQWGSCVAALNGGCACAENPVTLYCTCNGQYHACNDKGWVTYNGGTCSTLGDSCSCSPTDVVNCTSYPSTLDGVCKGSTSP